MFSVPIEGALNTSVVISGRFVGIRISLIPNANSQPHHLTNHSVLTVSYFNGQFLQWSKMAPGFVLVGLF